MADPVYELAKDLIKHALFHPIVDWFWGHFEGLSPTREQVKELYSAAKLTPIFPRHRVRVPHLLYEKAFESGGEVLYVSIMSRDSLIGMREYLKTAAENKTTLRALTLSSASTDDALEALRLHLGEHAELADLKRQIENASLEWSKLRKDHPMVLTDVRCYSSTPTLQGVLVKDEWALVELLPYHTYKDRRPALYVTANLEPELFELFQKSFEDLYASGQTVSATA